MDFNDEYTTIENEVNGVYKEKGSKFLSFAFSVNSVDHAKTIISEYKKKYFDARHVCYSYLIGPKGEYSRTNDDGEPSGTAGRPIMGQINSFGFTNILVIVVRYFGGVLLGTGGLVVAYKSATACALSQAKVLKKTIDKSVQFSFEFPYMNDVMRLIKKKEAKIINQYYNLDCVMEISIREKEFDALFSQLKNIRSVKIKNSDNL